jgi:hypothetical protein
MVFVNSMSDLFHGRVPLGFVRDVFAVIAETPRHTYQVLTKRAARLPKIAGQLDWPPNLWMGVSVEDAAAIARIGQLRQVPAAVRFISAEPLLGPLPGLDLSGIGQVIIGGESGPGARPMELEWAREIVRQCRASGTAPFVKQLGAVAGHATGAGPKGGDWERWPDDLKVREFPVPRSGLGNLGSPSLGMAEVSPFFPGGVTRSCDLSAATVCVEQIGEDLPDLLAAAYSAFECALQALRGAEDRAGPLLPALVLAAAAAADGLDAVAAAGPFAVPEPATLQDMSSPAGDVADQVDRLSLALFARLRDAAAGQGGSACAAAAACAGRMHELLTPPG